MCDMLIVPHEGPGHGLWFVLKEISRLIADNLVSIWRFLSLLCVARYAAGAIIPNLGCWNDHVSTEFSGWVGTLLVPLLRPLCKCYEQSCRCMQPTEKEYSEYGGMSSSNQLVKAHLELRSIFTSSKWRIHGFWPFQAFRIFFLRRYS